jgi:hypothetical protein
MLVPQEELVPHEELVPQEELVPHEELEPQEELVPQEALLPQMVVVPSGPGTSTAGPHTMEVNKVGLVHQVSVRLGTSTAVPSSEL